MAGAVAGSGWGKAAACGKGDVDQTDENGKSYAETDDSGEGLAGCGTKGGDGDRESVV